MIFSTNLWEIKFYRENYLKPVYGNRRNYYYHQAKCQVKSLSLYLISIGCRENLA